MVSPFRGPIRYLALISVAALASCCSSSGNEDGGGTASGGASNGSGGASGNGSSSGASGGGNRATGAQWIYTVDINNTLSAFHPDTLTFDDIGALACPSSGATPFSMAVDRDAVAWVLYSNGAIFQVDTGSASCSATTYQPDQDGLKLFGMGFSADQTTQSANGTDTLFIAGGATVSTTTNATLASLSFPALTVTTIGSVTGWPELTGTGDGELWGFAPGTAPTLSQIDKTTGASTTTFQLGSIANTNPKAWAQGFYGGAFFIFLENSSDNSTNVYEVERADGGLTTAVPNTGREIVGAGVSTCAPVSFE